MSRQWHIIGYDVCNPKRLQRVARILEGFGRRIQYSLFCVQASAKQIERLRWELSQVVEDEDHILIVGLCQKCSQNVMEQSGSIRWDAEPPSFQIVGGKFKDEETFDEDETKIESNPS